ncbi:hypothetical protein BDV12DRAFT_200562 [Aspergillus spectabilis]
MAQHPDPVKTLSTGTTGYIGGGSILTALFTSENKALKHVKITAVVRKEEQAQVLTEEGVNAIVFNGLKDVAQMKSLAREPREQRKVIETLPLRRTDVAILEKGRRLAVLTFILMSLLIYGVGTDLFNKQSIHIPSMVRSAMKAKSAEIVNDGARRRGNIHVADLGALYEVLIAKHLEGENIPTRERG